jgi:hypothetical protein
MINPCFLFPKEFTLESTMEDFRVLDLCYYYFGDAFSTVPKAKWKARALGLFSICGPSGSGGCSKG